ncbi:fumarylacetoacetate hydrolase family protein [Agromyces sp. Soil535]|uniref:fumarylacetoacetate hydrolase family protein n=1 Tax=Agromyces sp. Soil535 TaxID=1736390 RepID=UPI0006F724E4|nr:fumarylacetoacetate hydrolase family protein [Agromyces sp. Soil535]KRE24990.1 hypothetical protein ASG80_22140 [Agromyces sp. Soil535]
MTQIARFRYARKNRLGALYGGYYVDVNRSYAALKASQGTTDAAALADAVLPADMLALLRGADAGATALRESIAFAQSLDPAQAEDEGILVDRKATKTLIPIPSPPKIVCVARNYVRHAAEAGMDVPEIPILFPRFAITQVADGDPIIIPSVSNQVDWEGELAVVIGRGGRHISRIEALQHVAGYTIFNDVSVRDYQFRVSQYTAGKNFYATGAVGPHVTLSNEGIDPHNLGVTTSVNGAVKQDDNTRNFIFDIPTIIQHISEFVALEPGDLISTGTPAGVGFTRNPPEFLKAGDVVDVKIDGIGTLSNPVLNEVE